ncbi:MAG TPA: hypothetical protein VIM29_12760 [Bacillota bacterium]
MTDNCAQIEKGNLFELGHYISKEHLVARVMVERSEEIQHLNVEELKTKIINNFGPAALDILKDLLKESDMRYFNELNDINSLFELSNYAKLCYSDQQIRRRFLSDLGYNYCRTLTTAPNCNCPGLELVIYTADAIAFLARNKIQFIEDFSVLFSAVELPDTMDFNSKNARYDLGQRIKDDPELSVVFLNSPDVKKVRIRDFSAALQEAAYCDLTSGSFKATIPGLKQRGLTNGSNTNYGEKAYWDLFFWLCPGIWLRRNLAKTNFAF